MNYSIFYLTSIIISIAGIFLVWHLGLKKLMLDDFRDSLFATRDQLYELTREGRIDCDSDAYRAVELFINSMIQYAHRFTFLSFILSLSTIHEANFEKEEAAYSKELFEKIRAVEDTAVRDELCALITKVTFLLPRYIAKSSIAFMASALVYFALHSVFPMVVKGKQRAVAVFETEAYRAAESGEYSHA